MRRIYIVEDDYIPSGGGGNDNGKGCLGCLGSLAVIVVIAVVVWLASSLDLFASLQEIILLVTAGFAIRALVLTIMNISAGLSANFLQFEDFLPLIAGLGAGVVAFFLSGHNLKVAFLIGTVAANFMVSRT